MTFLPEQIQSLLAQDFEGDISILIRDDGSTDGTVDYLRKRDPRISLIEGRNLGPRGSFFELLQLAAHEYADFYALCDQDDVWHPQKIRRALSNLSLDRPALYASSLDLVDEGLMPIRNYTHPGNRSFASTLVCNFITGCTCVFNRAFLDQLPFPANPHKVIMHDWWLANVATISSDIRYDAASFIAYRQHNSNHVGIKSGLAARLFEIRNAFVGKPTVTRFDHARQFLAAAGERLDTAQRRIIDQFMEGEHSFLRRILFSIRHLPAVGWKRMVRFIAFG